MQFFNRSGRFRERLTLNKQVCQSVKDIYTIKTLYNASYIIVGIKYMIIYST